MNKERRYLEFEIRAEQTEEKGSVITGQPIVFNQETDLGFCRETIDVGALDTTDLRDVRFLVGHDFSMTSAWFRWPGAGTTTRTAPCS